MSIGHNGQLAAELEQILGDGDKVVFHYAQWHINDYLEGTKTMSLEYEGAFMRFLMHLYQNGKPFADNDAVIAKLLRLSTRVWKRLKEALIAMGNIVARNGCLTNPRFEEERQKRAQDARKRAAAAHARWQNSRETSAKVGESFPEVSPKFSPNPTKKSNEINESSMQMDMLTNNQNPITIKENKSPNGDSSSAQLELVPSDTPKLTASVVAREAFALYNELAKRCDLPMARVLDKNRARDLALRVKDAGGLDGFKQALANVEKSAFLRGQTKADFRADLNFICQRASFIRLFEGGYGNGAHASGGISQETARKINLSVYDGVQ